MAAVGLLVAGVVAPVESQDWFGPLEGLAPAAPAQAAEGTVVAGTPENCSTVKPDPDDDDTMWTVADGADLGDRECVLTTDAVCPDGHKEPTTPGTPSYLCYPERCADTAFDVNQLTNYLVLQPGADTPGDHQCRLFQLTECPAGVRPTLEGLCRYVKRRSWDCPDDDGDGDDDEYVKYTRFNSCYQDRPQSEAGTPPPCDTVTGAPTLTLVSCDKYAGNDYDNTQGCATISSHLTARSGGAAASYWCEFDESRLNVACHRNTVPDGADCAASTGVCLKRASTTRGQSLRVLGGCHAIVRIIDCAIHQADYADKVDTTGVDMEAEALRIREDGCEPCRVNPFEPLDSNRCPDRALARQPTTADINSYSAASQAGIDSPQRDAFRNKSDTRTGCQKLPPHRLTPSTSTFTGLAIVNTRVRLDIELDFQPSSHIPSWISTKGFGECFVATYCTSRGTLIGNTIRVVETCPAGGPVFYFEVAVKRLWPEADPDDPSSTSGDRSSIKKLFGDDSLQWWDALSTEEKTERTAAFYNSGAVNVVVPCNLQDPVWCVWEPSQVGYYSLTATGALYMQVFTDIRPVSGYGTIPDNWLSLLSWESLRKQECRRSDPSCPFTASVGTKVGLYLDESEPIGIQVHEVRAVSRTPSR